MRHLNARLLREQFHAQVLRRADSRRAVGVFVGVGLEMVDEFLRAARWNAGMHHEEIGLRRHHRERLQIAERVVAELVLVDMGQDIEVAGGDRRQRVAVGRRPRHRGDPDRAARAGAVLDHEGFAEPGRQPIREDARGDIGVAAGRVRHDQRHRLVRPGGLRPCRRSGRDMDKRRRRNGGHGASKRQALHHHGVLPGFYAFAGRLRAAGRIASAAEIADRGGRPTASRPSRRRPRSPPGPRAAASRPRPWSAFPPPFRARRR